MEKQISSTQNKLIKELLQLQDKSRNRRRSGKFVIEGRREIGLALSAGYQLQQLFYNSELVPVSDFEPLKTKTKDLIEVTPQVYQKIAYRSSTEGVLCIAKSKRHDLTHLKLSENPFILVAEAPEKPGNIGALLRTADAARVDAVIIANPKTDLYNPNIIRSSVGGVFTNQIATGSTSEIIAFLQNKNIQIFSATLQSSEVYTAQDFKKSTAIVVGTEAVGLSQEWQKHSTQNIIIPMGGKIDSMNVSVSAGILLFEVRRQRELGGVR